MNESVGAMLKRCGRSPAWCCSALYLGKHSTCTQVFRRYTGAEIDYFKSFPLSGSVKIHCLQETVC